MHPIPVEVLSFTQDVPAKRVTKLRKMVQGRGFLYKEYQRELVEQLWVSEGYQEQYDKLNADGSPGPRCATD